MEERYDSPKMTPVQWIANFWYYHKWLFLLAVVVLIFLAICIVQYATKEDSDLSVLYVGPAAVSQVSCEEMSQELAGILQDVNGDGSVFCEVRTISQVPSFDRLPPSERNQAMELYRSYLAEILGGDSCLLLVDPYFYHRLSEMNALVSFYEISENFVDASLGDRGVYLKNTPLYQLAGFSSLPEDTVLCLKYFPVVSDFDFEERVEFDENNLNQLRLIFQEA